MAASGKRALLSISFLSIMSFTLISPLLDQIGDSFPEASDLQIKMLVNLPLVISVLSGIVVGFISRLGGKKLILLLCIALYTLCGAGSAAAGSIGMLLILRALLGVGLGGITVLSTGMVSDFFSGEQATKVVGQTQASAHIGNILMTFFAGLLATASWRYALLLYLSGGVVFLIVLTCLPGSSRKKKTSETKAGRKGEFFSRQAASDGQPSKYQTASPAKRESESAQDAASPTLNTDTGVTAPAAKKEQKTPFPLAACLLLAGLIGVFYLGFSCVSLSTATLAADLGKGSYHAGILLMLFAAGGFFGSTAMPGLKKQLGHWGPLFCVLCTGGLFFCVGGSKELANIAAAILAAGFFGGALSAYFFAEALSVCPPDKKEIGTALVRAGQSAGSFSFPFLAALILGGEHSRQPGPLFLYAGCLLALLAIILFFYARQKEKKTAPPPA